jgi:hypothetical protein
MADDITLNPGTGGATLATDDIGGKHHQRVKIMHGADGVATDSSSATPFPVRQPGNVFDVTLALDTVIYAEGDILSNPVEIANFFTETGGTRILQSVVALDEDDQGFGFDLIFLDANNSLGTINAAPSIADVDARAIDGRVALSSADFYDLGGLRIATRAGIGLPLKGNASTSIWVAAISRGAGTYTASGIRLKLGVI